MDTAGRILKPVRRVRTLLHREKSIKYGSPDILQPQQRAENNPFPFERLPHELRSKIVRLIIPSIGSYSVGKRLGVSKRIRQRQWTVALEQHTRFANICLVNHWMLSEARAILYREVFYGFNEYLHQAQGRLCQPRLGPHFRFMQCYHINFLCAEDRDARAGCYTNAMARNVIRGYLEFIENLVEADRDIRRLKITLPCLQTLPQCESTIPDETENVDFLSPLQYLRVAEPVIFEFVDNTGLIGRPRACSCLKCEDMLRHIRAKFSRLKGGKMSGRDERWQRIQILMGQYRCDDEIFDRIRKLHVQFYDPWGRDINPLHSSFDEVAIETEAFIREKHRKWKEQRSTTVGRIRYYVADIVTDLAREIKGTTQRR